MTVITLIKFEGFDQAARMSRSNLHNKHMRQRWKGRSLLTAKADLPVRNEHRKDECPKNKPSKFITARCSLSKVAWLQESTSFGGHKIPKGGHRKVSGIVRAKVREEVRREIEGLTFNN